MPELPEVETVARGLRAALSGKTIVRASISAPDLYRAGSRRVEWLRGATVSAVDRVGKAIRILLAAPRGPRERALVVHLGMTGRFLIPEGRHTRILDGGVGAAPGPERVAGVARPPHRHGRFVFADNSELWYVDPRRFGYFFAGEPAGLRATLNIGPDPFEIDGAQLAAVLRGRAAPIKSLLLNQKIISGLGNIYVDELLFFARIHPLMPGARAGNRADDILAEARRVLRSAIKYGGTTFRDYRRADGTPGAFQDRLAVYGREGEPCIVCGRRITRVVIAARSSHFCSRCQRRPRAL